MIERLFVYGTLCPGQPNERVLSSVGGEWEAATVMGHLYERGWGAALGYPGIVLDNNGGPVDGFIFRSANLHRHWARLDAFEGDGYTRVKSLAKTRDGEIVDVHLYVLTCSP